MMALRPWQKWVGGIIASLVLSAIGSGLWQRVGDPVYLFGRDALLNLATLGLLTLKDALYTDVATGLHEDASIQTFILLLAIIILLTVVGLSITTLRFRRLGTPASIVPSSEAQTPNLQSKISLYIVLWPATLFIVVIFGFGMVRVTYTARAIANYQQLLNLVGPFVSNDDVKILNSQFSQIRSAKDYVTVTEHLKSIAQEHHLVLPEFSPW